MKLAVGHDLPYGAAVRAKSAAEPGAHQQFQHLGTPAVGTGDESGSQERQDEDGDEVQQPRVGAHPAASQHLVAKIGAAGGGIENLGSLVRSPAE